VVQPATGAFPEIIGRTNGGIVYHPDNIEMLSNTINMILNDNDLRQKLGKSGMKSVKEAFSLDSMSKALSEFYYNLP
jgi:glycosyltransferase involved in cell wall biosynthesis